MKAALTLAAVVALVAGCASAPVATPAGTPSGSSGIVRVTTELAAEGSRSQIVTVTDGVRSRVLYPDSGDAGAELINVSDGTTQVVCDSSGCRRDAASPASGPGTAQFKQRCPQARQTGTGHVAGRPTTIWSCALPGETELEFDVEFPSLQMRGRSAGYLTWEVVQVEAGVAVPADFFSLEPPGRRFVPATPKRVTPPKPGAEGAVLPRFGGGELRMTSYTAGPAVIVVGEESQVRPALARLRRVADGAPPKVAGVVQLHDIPDNRIPTEPFDVPVALNPDDGKAWQDMTGSQTWPVAVFCKAAGKGCVAIAVWDLSDAELSAELAKVR